MTMRAILITVAALGLASCATMAPGNYHIQAERALLTVETSYHAAASAELDAKAAGLLTGDNATQADELRHKGYSALLVARAAYNNGQMPDTLAIAQITTQILALIPKGH